MSKRLKLTLAVCALLAGCTGQAVPPAPKGVQEPTLTIRQQSAAPNPGMVTIRIHFLDAVSGKPFKFAAVDLEYRPAGKLVDYDLGTDAHGIAEFDVPGPLPDQLTAAPDDGTYYMVCSQIFFCTRDVLSAGVAATDDCWHATKKHPQPPYTLSPGDIFIFALKHGSRSIDFGGLFHHLPANAPHGPTAVPCKGETQQPPPAGRLP